MKLPKLKRKTPTIYFAGELIWAICDAEIIKRDPQFDVQIKRGQPLICVKDFSNENNLLNYVEVFSRNGIGWIYFGYVSSSAPT